MGEREREREWKKGKPTGNWQRRNWRPQMKGEIGLVFACEFPHRKSTSCHRFDEWWSVKAKQEELRDGGRQADGRQTLGKFPPPAHAHIEGVCVEVENVESRQR